MATGLRATSRDCRYCAVSVDDDWAPLPPDTVDLPGGDAKATPAARPSTPLPKTLPPALPRAPADRPHAPPTPAEVAAGDRALQDLLQRLVHRERTADPVRRALAHAARKQALAAPLVPAAATTAAAPEPLAASTHAAVQYDGDRDPREDEPWFAHLPAAARQRLRDTWHRERHRFDGRSGNYWRDVRRAALQGAFVFLLLALLQAPMLGSLGPLPALTLAGAVAGAVARLGHGGRFAFALAGAAAFLLVMGPSLGSSLVQPLGLTSVLLASYGMGLLGIDREMQRSGGFDDAARPTPPTPAP